MDVKEFINTCVDKGYEWSEGDLEDKEGYYAGSRKLDTCAHFTTEAIADNNWSTLEKQIIQGKDVHHITRIVGYFSRVENWNKSKIGELKDRHQGDYTVKV